MKRNAASFLPLNSSFLSCEKDAETIFRKLFVESQPHSDELKRLLVISAKDCLDNKEKYQQKIDEMTLAKLYGERYIRLEPKIHLEEHNQVKSFIRLDFDDFAPNFRNPEFRDCTVNFTIVCHSDFWDIGNFRSRPLKIAGYIDGIMNKARLSGIGMLLLTGCEEHIWSQDLSGYILSYRAIHWTEDRMQNAE